MMPRGGALLPLGLLLLAVAEIAVFVAVVHAVGAGWALLLLVPSSILGFALLRRGGDSGGGGRAGPRPRPDSRPDRGSATRWSVCWARCCWPCPVLSPRSRACSCSHRRS